MVFGLTKRGGYYQSAVQPVNGRDLAGTKLQAATSTNLKRYTNHSMQPADWFGTNAEDPYWILDTIEFKTAWHRIGL